jgi:hypothetical protein
MHQIPPHYTKGVQEGLEVFIGAKCLSPEDQEIGLLSTLSENLSITDPKERARVPTLGDVICNYNYNENYLRMHMYQGVYAEIPFSNVSFQTIQGDYGPLEPYIGCIRLDGPSRFGINAWLLDSGASVHMVQNQQD